MVKHRKDLGQVKTAMRGNPKAFGELIRQRQEALYRMAYLTAGNEQDALDAVQECILRAYKSIRSLKHPEYFDTWLMRIVIRTAQDICKKRRPREELEWADQLPAPEGITAEERMDLYDAMGRLPENYRDVVQLKYFSGLTTREIAQQMDVPEGTVSSWLSRAISRMRDDMKEEQVCRQK